jgi:hypothetical protein
MRAFFFIMALGSLGIIHQADAYDTAQAKRDGQSLANGNMRKAQSTTQRSLEEVVPGTKDATVGQSINFKGTEVPEKAYNDKNMKEVASNKAADENFTAGIIAKKGFLRSKEFEIKHSDTLFDRAKDAQKNPESYVAGLTGKYTDCKSQGGDDVKYLSLKTCDEYQEISDHTCKVGQIMEVDAKHKYECNKKRVALEKKCSRKLNVTIVENKDVLSGVSFHTKQFIDALSREYTIEQSIRAVYKTPDGELNYNYPILKLKPAFSHYLTNMLVDLDRGFNQNLWMDKHRQPGNFYTTVNELSFSIADKSKVISLRIEQNSAQVYALRINDKLLTSGNDSNQAAKCLDKVFDACPQDWKWDIRGTILTQVYRYLPQHYLNLNGYDLTPYLKDGDNKLTFSNTFDYYLRGQAKSEMTIKVQTVDLQEDWEESCDGGIS